MREWALADLGSDSSFKLISPCWPLNIWKSLCLSILLCDGDRGLLSWIFMVNSLCILGSYLIMPWILTTMFSIIPNTFNLRLNIFSIWHSCVYDKRRQSFGNGWTPSTYGPHSSFVCSVGSTAGWPCTLFLDAFTLAKVVLTGESFFAIVSCTEYWEY